MLRRSTAYMASCLLAVVLVSLGSDAASLKGQTAFGRSLTSNKKFMARLLESDCAVGFYSSSAAPPPPAYGAYPPPSAAYPPPPAAYPSSYPPPPPPASDCTPCPAGSTSPVAASSVTDCTACAAGFTTSGAGGACVEIGIPAIDLRKQRDVLFEFLGPEFTTFQGESQAYRDEFNSTITSRMAAAITNNGVWVYAWNSGSIVADTRVSFADGTSAGDMDNAINYLVDNAGSVFGDLSAFGVTGVRGVALNDDDDDDSNALAIGLGVGLGLGIPLIAGIIFFCFWKKRRDGQNVAPNAPNVGTYSRVDI
eukprot:gene13738-19640_t